MKVLQDGGEEAVLMKKIIVFQLVRSGKIISGESIAKLAEDRLKG